MMRTGYLSAVIAAAVAVPAGAATISVLPLDGGNYQDPENLVVDYLRGAKTPSAGTERDVRADRDNAQSFSVQSDTVIDKIAINYSALSTTGGATTFQFFRVTTLNASTLTPDGDIIDDVVFSGSDTAFGGNSAGTLIFDVANTVASAGDAFAIRFDTDSATSLSIKWEILHDDRADAGFTDGAAYEKNSSNLNKVYTVGVVAVPEPASLGLLGIGALGLLRRSRRQG